jgi:hypothetical protein
VSTFWLFNGSTTDHCLLRNACYERENACQSKLWGDNSPHQHVKRIIRPKAIKTTRRQIWYKMWKYRLSWGYHFYFTYQLYRNLRLHLHNKVESYFNSVKCFNTSSWSDMQEIQYMSTLYNYNKSKTVAPTPKEVVINVGLNLAECQNLDARITLY